MQRRRFVTSAALGGAALAAALPRPAPLRPETVHYLLQNGQPLPPADPPAFDFPSLEDADSIQLSISLLFAAIVAGQIGPDQARTLLYALQIASSNVHRTSAASNEEEDSSTVVRRIVRTRHGQTLAAPGDNNGVPSQSERPKSLLDQFFEEYGYPSGVKNDDATPSESNI